MSTVLNPLTTTQQIADHYRRYLESTFLPRDPVLAEELRSALAARALTRGPYLEASAPFEPGCSVADLVAEGVLSQMFLRHTESSFPIDRSLHRHQEVAIRKSVGAQRNLVVTTGTGSGKTETFLIPLLDMLFREVEAGTAAEPGVRALLLYPMNALANDQVKRLRRLLEPFAEITFGRYVGETDDTQTKAEDSFRKRYPKEPRIPNELISRDEMKAAPPHLLLTNYAMLEYLLLRPADSNLFDGETGKHWRALVLDEAHVYDGAQGTEVAMLLRRVRDRVVSSERSRLRCFATSATLGSGEKDFPKLTSFAEQLFDETFEWDADDPDRQDIVVAERKRLVSGEIQHRLPQDTFTDLQRAFRAGAPLAELAAIVEAAGGQPPPGEPSAIPKWLGDLLATEASVVEVQRHLEDKHATELGELADLVFDGPEAARDLVALVDLCVAARRQSDDAPLIPARYHLWVGSLEGGFLCLSPEHDEEEPRLHLNRSKLCLACEEQGRLSHLVEVGVCRSCGSAYALGQINAHEQRLETVSDRRTPQDYFLLADESVESDEDDESLAVAQVMDVQPCRYDPRTGTVAGGLGAGVPVQWVKRSDTTQPIHRCVGCGSTTSGEVIFRLVTGVDAPVSVIATDLYQALPVSADPEQRLEVGQGRKLLAFADSRQDAAYFAPYLERTYGRSVARRLIATAIEQLTDGDDYPRSEDIAKRARRLAEDALLLDPDAAPAEKKEQAAYWVAQEILALDRRQSLEGLGLAEIRVALSRRYEPPGVLLEAGFDESEARDLLLMLLDTIRLNGAVTVPDEVDIRDDRFAPRNVETGVREVGSAHGAVGWCPTGSANNRRLDILKKALIAKGLSADASEVLRRLWVEELTSNDAWRGVLVSSSDSRKGVTWRINHERLEFVPSTADRTPRRCDRCRRLWWRTVAGICPGWRCPGTVEEAVSMDEIHDNHYAALYGELEPIGMAVQEHTAQWKSDRASAIQDDFTRGRLNVLSCSTTFELGVDVGEVQAVLLRNVPPRAANYVQRAGRAGRRQDSAALVVTYAQRRSHDHQHFRDPKGMINGTIDPPMIMLDNEPIVRRHVHSVAFAAFERHVVTERGLEAHHRTVEQFFIAHEVENPGDTEFIEWLTAQPGAVRAALERIVPAPLAELIGLSSFAWVQALVEPTDDEPSFGWLRRAATEVREDLTALDEQMEELAGEKEFGRAEGLRKLRNTLARRHLLGFLASRNVLPKYGFPVDVVDLDVSGQGGQRGAELDLSRDLRQAISMYAPGAEVVAGKALWRSTGVRRRSGLELPSYEWRVCKECGAFRSALNNVGETCWECGASTASIGGTYLHPVFGFVGRPGGEPGDSRPATRTVTNSWFGSYRDDPPDFEICEELSGRHQVQRRTSRQGRIITINRGPEGRRYRFCNWCGYGEPAPRLRKSADGQSKAHKDLRRPSKDCGGPFSTRELGHEYLTDVAEVRIAGVGRRYPEDATRAMLYALLAAAPRLGIARDDVDGTLHHYSSGEPPALVLFDAVPGGAGHAHFLADNLPELFRQALALVEKCECAETESCYSCLRTYGNQAVHEQLVRGDAIALLVDLLGDGPAQYEDFSPLVRELIGGAVTHGVEEPVAGYEVEDPAASGWMIEAAWPDERVGITIDDDEKRDRWLKENGWDVRRETDWILPELVRALSEAGPQSPLHATP